MMRSDRPTLFSLSNITVKYSTTQLESSDIIALDNVSVSVCKGDFVRISGHNGSGKSTLLHVIAGLIPHVQGHAIVDNQVVKAHLIPKYVNLAMVYQNPDDAIVPFMTVRDHLVFRYLRNGKNRHKSRKQAHEDCMRFCAKHEYMLPLWKRLDDEAMRLSGGWKQMLQLACVICSNPDLILLDEPTSQLSLEFVELANTLISTVSSDCTVIIVSHAELSEVMQSRVDVTWRMVNGTLDHD